MPTQKFLSHLDNNPALGNLLWRSARLWQQYVNDAVAPLQLTNTQAVILLACARSTQKQGPLTLTDVVKHTSIGKMSASQAVRTLISKNLLTSKPSTDKRSKALILTEEGRHRAHQASIIISKAHEDFFSDLSPVAKDELGAMLAYIIKEKS
jgi:DNA-binding MarR family transcriptional regulator